ncbi:MAG: peptidoglycan D,D-transpeptidase FtsI family protein, partial [Myxococcota bacterium]
MRRFETRLPVVAPRWRVWFVGSGLALLLALLVAKAAHLQLGLGHELRELAERQYVRKLKVSAPRGNIYDRHGRPLAVTVPAWSIAAEPRRIEDPAAAAKVLAPLLDADVRTLQDKLSSEKSFQWLARRIAPEAAERVRAANIGGISLREEARRYYPNRELAGQLLGLVNLEGDGVDGVELAFNEHLRGRSTVVPGLRDNRGRRIVMGGAPDFELLEGDDVHLTLDARLQDVAERALLEALDTFDAVSAFAIVLEPDTGAILAMANVPLFNPNDPGASPKGARRNHALSDAFEPGSVFKIVSFASALEQGQLTAADQIYCENGRLELGKYVIRDAHPAGWLSAAEVFSHSSNIGTIKIVQRVGEEHFRTMISNFGFGQPPGLGLLGETAGRMPDSTRWGEVRTATVSYGHGLMASALQVAMMVAAVANDGVLVEPRLLGHIASPTGQIVRRGQSRGRERAVSSG